MKAKAFKGARIFEDEEAARNYYRRKGLSEEQIAQMHIVSAEGLPRRVLRNMIVDEGLRKGATRNERRRMRRLAAKG